MKRGDFVVRKRVDGNIAFPLYVVTSTLHCGGMFIARVTGQNEPYYVEEDEVELVTVKHICVSKETIKRLKDGIKAFYAPLSTSWDTAQLYDFLHLYTPTLKSSVVVQIEGITNMVKKIVTPTNNGTLTDYDLKKRIVCKEVRPFEARKILGKKR